MNEIKVFENEQFGSVRTTTIDGEPWFVAADVCRALEINNNRMALGRLDDDEKMTVSLTDSHSGQRGGAQSLVFVNEAGLYTLVMGSRKPEAKSFKRWVTHEVIPTIRKHGAYMTPETIERTLTDPDFIIQLATELKVEQQRRKELEQKVEADAPKVLLAEQITNSTNSIMVKEMAHILSQNGFKIGQNNLYKLLREEKYLCSSKGERWNLPTQMALNQGLFEVKESARLAANGQVIDFTTYVTPRGQEYFLNRYINKKE